MQLLAIAEEMLAGEIAYRRGEHDAAFAHLRAAIALEDDLPYDEPWGWMQPVRHALGALLLEQGRAAEAEAVYREDLGLGGALPRAQIHPDNLWALRGLLDCLERRGETAEAALIRQRVEFAAARADLPVSVSCFCARGDGGLSGRATRTGASRDQGQGAHDRQAHSCSRSFQYAASSRERRESSALWDYFQTMRSLRPH